MELTCDRCGRTFTAARADARYCSGKCRTDAYRERKNPNAKPVRRRSITDSYTDLVWALEKSVSRLERVGRDDRFAGAVRKGSIHTGQLENLQRRIGVLLGGDDDQAEAATDERPGASDWSRRVQNISATIPMDDLTEDEVLELGGAAETLHNYTKGELITRGRSVTTN